MIAHHSLTHVHLLAALRAELNRHPAGEPLRILDVGCGRAGLIGYLHQAFKELEPGRVVELYGFDVAEPGVQRPGFLSDGIQDLTNIDATVNWQQRLSIVYANERWPYPDDSFDFVISNQVLEHVADHDAFFGELTRVLKRDAVALHCFPLKECMWEGHVLLPCVHWLASHQNRKSAIKLLSRLGLGLFAQHRRSSGISLDAFAERHADFLNLYTNYLTARQILAALKRRRLRGSFTYTGGLYTQKLRALCRRPCCLRYTAADGCMKLPTFWFLKRLASITLRVEKADAYRASFG